MTTPEAIAAVADRARRAGQRLRALPVQTRCAILDRAAALLGDASTALGRQARAALPERTGLSPAMVEWALNTTLSTLDRDELLALYRRHVPGGERARPVPPGLAVVVLAGNVFTAAVRGVVFPWLLGAPVLAKVPSSERSSEPSLERSEDSGQPDPGLIDFWVRALERAAADTGEDLTDTCVWTSFAGGSRALEEALFARADLVSVYGSDATTAAIRDRLPVATRFLAHGHGVSAGYVAASSLVDAAAAREAAARVAVDVAAYDQRGCLSPQTIWVERGAGAAPRDFAALLFDALAALEPELPRGRLDGGAAAGQMQWRGVAEAVSDDVWQADTCAVSYEPGGPMRSSPGYRHVQIVDARDAAHAAGALGHLGDHLKCIGVAGGRDAAEALAGALPGSVYPQIVPAGVMQTPGLDSFADGRPPLAGMLRFIDMAVE